MTAPHPFRFELAYQRERRGLSLAALGRVARIDRTYIGRLESGERSAGRSIVERLATGLELKGGDRDAFFASAGFLPPSYEAELRELADAFADPMLPDDAKETMRTRLGEAVAMARKAPTALEDA